MSIDYSALMWYGWYVESNDLEEMYKHSKDYQLRLSDGENEEWLMGELDDWLEFQYKNIQCLNYYYGNPHAVGVFFDPRNKTVLEFAEELTKRFGELTEWWGKTFVSDYPMPHDFKLNMNVQAW